MIRRGSGGRAVPGKAGGRRRAASARANARAGHDGGKRGGTSERTKGGAFPPAAGGQSGFRPWVLAGCVGGGCLRRPRPAQHRSSGCRPRRGRARERPGRAVSSAGAGTLLVRPQLRLFPAAGVRCLLALPPPSRPVGGSPQRCQTAAKPRPAQHLQSPRLTPDSGTDMHPVSWRVPNATPWSALSSVSPSGGLAHTDGRALPLPRPEGREKTAKTGRCYRKLTTSVCPLRRVFACRPALGPWRALIRPSPAPINWDHLEATQM